MVATSLAHIVPVQRSEAMPQTFVAVQCAFCHAFQGSMNKKSKRFACAVCGQKQSFRHVHAVSNSGQDIRKVVRELNELRGAHEQAAGQVQPTQVSLSHQQACSRDQEPSVEWDDFAEAAAGQDIDAEEDGPYVTTLPDSMLRGKGRLAAESCSKRQKVQQGAVDGHWSCSTRGSVQGHGSHTGVSQAAPLPAKQNCSVQQHQERLQQPNTQSTMQAARCKGLTLQAPAVYEQQHKASHLLPQHSPQQHQQQYDSTAWHHHQQPWAGTIEQHHQQPQQKPVHGHQQRHQTSGTPAGVGSKQQTQMQLKQQQANTIHHQNTQQQQQHTHQHQARTWGQRPQQQQQGQQGQSRVQPGGKPPKVPGHQWNKVAVRSTAPRHSRAAAASSNAWGRFIDDDTHAYSSDEEAEGAVDEQGCCSVMPQAVGPAPDTTAPSRVLSRWT